VRCATPGFAIVPLQGTKKTWHIDCPGVRCATPGFAIVPLQGTKNAVWPFPGVRCATPGFAIVPLQGTKKTAAWPRKRPELSCVRIFVVAFGAYLVGISSAFRIGRRPSSPEILAILR
jgi:hypothetical protein